MAQTITDAALDAQIAKLMLELISARGAGKSICPSEVARALLLDAAIWRSLMPQVRAVAYCLAAQQQLRITQRGRAIDPLGEPAIGAIRLGLPVRDAPLG
jgi:hypothetical protein